MVFDSCPDDPAKTKPGNCGCGTADSDLNANGILDCQAGGELRVLVTEFQKQFGKLKAAKKGKISKKQKKQLTDLKALLLQIEALSANPLVQITTSSGTDIKVLVSDLAKLSRKAFKIKSAKFKPNKKKAVKNLQAVIPQIQG